MLDRFLVENLQQNFKFLKLFLNDNLSIAIMNTEVEHGGAFFGDSHALFRVIFGQNFKTMKFEKVTLTRLENSVILVEQENVVIDQAAFRGQVISNPNAQRFLSAKNQNLEIFKSSIKTQ